MRPQKHANWERKGAVMGVGLESKYHGQNEHATGFYWFSGFLFYPVFH